MRQKKDMRSFQGPCVHQWGERHPKLQAIPRHPKGCGNVVVVRSSYPNHLKTFSNSFVLFISQFATNKAK
ncbi:hypothetical protein CR513_49148, partial [Mucuna pruriens]